MENPNAQSSLPGSSPPLDKKAEPVNRRRKRVPVDENGMPIKRKKISDGEIEETVKNNEALPEESGTPAKRKKAAEGGGEPVKRKRPPTDGEQVSQAGGRVRRKRPHVEIADTADSADEGERKVRRKQPQTDKSSEPEKHKQPAIDDDSGRTRRRRTAKAENSEALRRKRPHVDTTDADEHNELSEPVRRRRPSAGESSAPVRRRRPPADEYERKPWRNRIMNEDANKNTKPNNPNSSSEEKERNTSRGCLFPVLLILICIAVFVGSFTVLAGFMSDHSFNDLVSILKGEEISEDETEATTEESNYINADELLDHAENQLYNTERDGVVSQISLGSNTMKIYDTENKTSVIVNFSNSTKMTDENGSDITITKVNEGDPIIFVYDEDKNLLSLQLHPDAEELTSLAVSVNTNRKLITIGSDVFKYNSNTVFRYKDGVLSPKDITEYDVITIKALDYDAWGVIMEKSHGTLTFVNYENISGATYSVDEGSFNKFPEDSVIYLTEGVHTITVKGNSISDYTSKVIIKANSETELSLAGTQLLRGSLIVDSTESGAALYVDGVQKSLRNPMFLDYGTHKLSLKTSYGNTITKTITIDQEETEITIP
ncbi:MAG: hypothetical protein LIO44_02305 [Eubacterium sp.]|nr:hypothetical protein [Eubacterium sp.]